MEVDRRTRAEVFGDGTPIAASRYLVSDPIPPHVHDFIELALITSGAARHSTADGTVHLGAGDVVVVRPGTWHAYAPVIIGATFGVMNAYLGPELVQGQLSWLLDYPQLARLLLLGGRLPEPLSADHRHRVEGWLSQLAQEQHRPEAVVKAALLTCVLVEICRGQAEQRPGAPAPISRSVRTALRLMTEDMALPWTVPELARRAGLSPSSLYRQFREQLGAGPVEWLTRTRAEAAATLLVQTDLPVAAVGRRVGWPDPSYTSRRFSQIYHLSPTAYRSAHTNDYRAVPVSLESARAP